MTEPAAERRRVHPITPVVNVISLLPAVVVFAFLIGPGLITSAAGVAAVIGLIVVFAVLLLGYQYLAYQRLAYWFDDAGDLRVQSGVLVHNERRLRLSRLQTVDIIRPLVARIFGFAAVRIEVAGAGDSRADLKYLAESDAQSLRNEILARSAGVRHDAGEAPEQPLLSVPTKDLLLSLLMRMTTVVLALVTVVIVVSNVVLSGWTGLFTVFLYGIPLLVVFSEFSQLYNFTIAESPDGLRLRHGLLQTQSRTIPPGRVCAVEFVEPLLWRRRGWVRLMVTVAGLAQEKDDAGTQSVLLPVAPRAVAEQLFARVMPGADPASVPMQSPVAAVRRRSPIQWRSLAGGTDSRIAVLRRGRITRRTAIVDHARVQSVRLTQGPWERWLGLTSVHLDLPPGRISAAWLHFGVDQAHELATTQVQHMRRARASDKSIKWMKED